VVAGFRLQENAAAILRAVMPGVILRMLDRGNGRDAVRYLWIEPEAQKAVSGSGSGMACLTDPGSLALP
jgi:hypothetical protein